MIYRCLSSLAAYGEIKKKQQIFFHIRKKHPIQENYKNSKICLIGKIFYLMINFESKISQTYIMRHPSKKKFCPKLILLTITLTYHELGQLST